MFQFEKDKISSENKFLRLECRNVMLYASFYSTQESLKIARVNQNRDFTYLFGFRTSIFLFHIVTITSRNVCQRRTDLSEVVRE